jgi:imidazolonepropionase-like amidohydrolase
VFSGQPALVDLGGDTVDAAAIKPSVGMVFAFPSQIGGQSFDFTTSQTRRTSDTEAKKQRDKRLDEIRTWLRDADAYAKAVDARVSDPGLPLMPRDRQLEALRPFVKGEQPFIISARDERDIRAAIEFADEMKLKMILRVPGSSDVAKVAPLLAQRKIPVIIGSLFALPYRDDDRYDLPLLAPAALAKAGVRFAFATEESAMVKDLPYLAAMPVAYGGLSKEDAMRAITIWPAEIWGIGSRVGSIEAGKVANLVVATGDPLETWTDVKRVFVNGRPVPLENRQSRFADQFNGR